MFENIQSIIHALTSIDWSAFFMSLAATWFLIEKGLKVLTKITPWEWDDDLVNWVSSFMSSVAKKKSG